MKHKFILLIFLNFLCLAVRAQQVDVDTLFKQALYQTNVTNNYPKAIQIAKQALTISPSYIDIKLLLGKLYTLNGQPDSAKLTYIQVLSISPNDIQAMAALKRLENDQNEQQIASLKNRVGITYNPTFFEKEGKATWNLVNVYYGRKTNWGTIIGRINYADRAYASGYQFEVEAYPKHKNGYSFINIAYSAADIFQKYRASYSYLRNFDKGWEGELGVRYQYKTTGLLSYGGSVGKYVGNYWFNLRAYLTPNDGRVAQSYTFTTRYYLNTADDYFTAIVGTGISPDDRARNFEFSERLNTSSLRLSLGYQTLVFKRNVIGIIGTYNREEYIVSKKENEYDIAFSFVHRF